MGTDVVAECSPCKKYRTYKLDPFGMNLCFRKKGLLQGQLLYYHSGNWIFYPVFHSFSWRSLMVISSELQCLSSNKAEMYLSTGSLNLSSNPDNPRPIEGSASGRNRDPRYMWSMNIYCVLRSPFSPTLNLCICTYCVSNIEPCRSQRAGELGNIASLVYCGLITTIVCLPLSSSELIWGDSGVFLGHRS